MLYAGAIRTLMTKWKARAPSAHKILIGPKRPYSQRPNNAANESGNSKTNVAIDPDAQRNGEEIIIWLAQGHLEINLSEEA